MSLSENFVTKITHIWIYAFVNHQDMIVIVLLFGKRIVTFFALIRNKTFVDNLDVIFQICFGRKFASALITLFFDLIMYFFLVNS